MEIPKIQLHSFNLVQNFYIIGLDRKNDELISSILSRYPLVDLPYINVSDEVIINVRKKINNLLNNYSIVFQIVFK